MSSNYIKIDSAKRLNYTTTSPGQVTIPLNQRLSGKYSVKQVFITNSNFNVTTTNNRIPFFENGADKVAVITPGFYNSTATLLTQVANALTTASGGFSVFTASMIAIPFRIQVSSTHAFNLRFGAFPVNSAAELLGFLGVDNSQSTLQVATNVCNLAMIRSFNINISGCNTGFTDTNGNNFTLSIPIFNNTLSLTLYEPTLQFPQYVEFTSPAKTLNISIVDDNNNTIALCTDWYIILQQVC